jgi:RNA polymerase sigma-70 factor (ECF subfamily)
MTEEERSHALDGRVRELVGAGQVGEAATLSLRKLGPEVFGFLRAVVGSEADADEIFSATSERLWKSLPTFHWRCALRTWFYVLARNEVNRFIRGARRREARRATPSQLDHVVAAVRTETQSALRTEKRDTLNRLRNELPVEDRMLLVLRVDRGLEWDAIAPMFLEDAADSSPEEIKREAARLRKRFQLVKGRLSKRAREEGLLSS